MDGLRFSFELFVRPENLSRLPNCVEGYSMHGQMPIITLVPSFMNIYRFKQTRGWDLRRKWAILSSTEANLQLGAARSVDIYYLFAAHILVRRSPIQPPPPPAETCTCVLLRTSIGSRSLTKATIDTKWLDKRFSKSKAGNTRLEITAHFA